MNRLSKILCLLLFVVFLAALQVRAQDFSIKSNALYWGMLAPNLGVEIPISQRFTTDLQLIYRPWRGHVDGNLKFWGVQPEVRYWFCESFEGHFIGMHLHGGQYYRKHHGVDTN